jgi:putative transposase
MTGPRRKFTPEEKARIVLEILKEETIDELYGEVGKLTTQLSWLKKNLVSNLSREERIYLMEWDCHEHAIIVQADLLH